eukprot:TRINITY_DN6438_c0_g2_i1.p1 TRINITY_DN6438_c0_g2~~TRINITY_DN6438_c0_g2_i1.p1  ORF type:complete len:645 (+),score=109.57 TRINITY_DN6438_c0_g2_i1:74-2008(+)
MSLGRGLVVLTALSCLSSWSEARFVYVPNSILERREGGHVDSQVNSLTSTDGIIPFGFYDLQFCRPNNHTAASFVENLGTLLRGDKIEDSPYSFAMLQNTSCTMVACKEKDNVLNKEALKKFEKRIVRGYRGNMIVDYLPALRSGKLDKNNCKKGRNPLRTDTDVRGFAIGGCSKSEVYINNHLDFTIEYNYVDTTNKKDSNYYVVGFYVSPRSIGKRNAVDKCSMENPATHFSTKLAEGETTKSIEWSYSVKWKYNPAVEWVTRWDNYLNSSEADTDAQAHWLRITQSILVILCLSGVVAIILMRTLHLDFNRYNNPDNEEEMQEEVGWKLVHTDVFRPPSHPNLFAAVIGTGTQLLGMSCATLLFALLGFLSPARRGFLLTTLILLFVLMAFFNGYVTGLLQMMFSVRQWKTVVFAGTAFPGFIFLIWGFSEALLAHRGAANAVPVGTVFSIIGLWFGICLPQAILGASFSYRQAPIENPLRYNVQEKAIPSQKWLFSYPATILLPGIVPFAAALTELSLLMRSIWQGQVYYVFGFLSLVFVVSVITVCLTVIVYIYYQLVFEDYRWWWKSIFVPSGMGVYYFLYAIHYYNSTLNVKTWLAAWMYFSFCGIVAVAITLIAGTVGFYAAWMFTRKIYRSIKIE